MSLRLSFPLCLLLAACGSSPNQTASEAKAESGTGTELAGQDWQAPAGTGASLDGQPLPQPWLRIDGDQLSGSTSCNGMNGQVQLDGSKLSFVSIATSKRYCMETADQESAFLKALRSTAFWRIQRGKLELLDSNQMLVLSLEAKSTP